MTKTQINAVIFRRGLTRINTVNKNTFRRGLTRINTVILFSLAILLILNSICPAAHKSVPASDGLVLDGVDGKISVQNDQWSFTTFERLTDGKGVMSSPAVILPSSMLEKLGGVFSAEKSSYRIWGKLTKYNNKNFIYLSYFLPVAEVNEPNTTEIEENKDTNETQIIPDDALALLKPKRVISLAELKKPLGVEADGILTDRTGFLHQAKDGDYFGFDALGRNIDLTAFPLLACEELENMEKAQKASAFPVRFKISAIVTKYKGKNYLLLQRATKLFSFGNLAR